MKHCSVLSVQTLIKRSGGNRAGDTPVPIPNTEVKPCFAEDTWRVTARENRALPELFILDNILHILAKQ